MKAMILAAGRGERMLPLTEKTAKPLLKIGDYGLIEYHLFALAKAGIRDVVINVNHFAEQIIEKLGDGARYNLSIQYSVEDKLLGTGGGIYHALSLLGNEPFLLVSADIYTDYPFQKLFTQPMQMIHLVMVDNPHFNPDGDFALAPDGQLMLAGNLLTYGNIALINPKLFAQAKPGVFPLAPLFSAAIKNHQATGEYYQGSWYNVGSPDILQGVQNSCTLASQLIEKT